MNRNRIQLTLAILFSGTLLGCIASIISSMLAGISTTAITYYLLSSAVVTYVVLISHGILTQGQSNDTTNKKW